MGTTRDGIQLGHLVGKRGPFKVPLTVATETLGILAVKRAGKSNVAVVMAEEMFDAGIPWVAIDPKGDWWGVRSSKDGKGPGLPVVVFGGEHADVPLEPTAGHMLASLIAERHLTCVLDVSGMTKADLRRFLTDFTTTLYRKNREPLHVFFEEADEYIPQRVMGEMAKLVGACETLVKRGGFHGIGVTLVTQRSASLNKDVLTQCGTLIALRTTSPQDRKAILGWVQQHADGAEIVDALPGLPNGEAWVWSPEWLAEDLTHVQFRQRRTFDSGATPVVGRKRAVPTTLADVDLAKIKEEMAETVERAKADDPKELRKRIKELERQLASQPAAEPVEPVVVTEYVVHAGSVEAMAKIRDTIGLFSDEIVGQLAALSTELADAQSKVGDKPTSLARTPHVPVRTSGGPQRTAELPKPQVKRSQPTEPSTDTSVSGPQRKLLVVLATYGPRTKRQLALQGGYSERGGGFNNPLGALRTGGLITRGEPITITDEGLAALGGYEELPRGSALLDHWYSQIRGPEKKILSVLVQEGELTKADLAERAGYQPTGGGFNNPLGRLRTLGLVDRGDPIRLTDEFSEAIS